MILNRIQNIELSIRKISDMTSQIPNCLRADIGEPNYPIPDNIFNLIIKNLNTSAFQYSST